MLAFQPRPGLTRETIVETVRPTIYLHGKVIGIDLGTTNSAVALLHGVDTEVLKNNDGDETTPSAVWVDRRERLYVGRAARDRAEADPDNTCMEFKLRMGTAGAAKRFAASGRETSPEELSAEVLKSLRADVRQRTGSEISSAVVTVPTAFDIHSCDATRRAAELAGLSFSPLLQEPTRCGWSTTSAGARSTRR
ncbi:Hsp70 family protein [Allokutzneria sp. A3M-2-11 16]|uniref:Hsp70 family protein n=1 Tax=Allokutzneria sp. A3M-2-11 16 TaxID=2962043 RepID=UPI0020B8908F|nr:Hsp70 family protein [Allokutzneria sp. A3M-2-11 16]MCP3804377.1 Hsp70 family protein [Allokutzneria sp. A3M-2-11 16]